MPRSASSSRHRWTSDPAGRGQRPDGSRGEALPLLTAVGAERASTPGANFIDGQQHDPQDDARSLTSGCLEGVADGAAVQRDFDEQKRPLVTAIGSLSGFPA